MEDLKMARILTRAVERGGLVSQGKAWVYKIFGDAGKELSFPLQFIRNVVSRKAHTGG